MACESFHYQKRVHPNWYTYHHGSLSLHSHGFAAGSSISRVSLKQITSSVRAQPWYRGGVHGSRITTMFKQSLSFLYQQGREPIFTFLMTHAAALFGRLAPAKAGVGRGTGITAVSTSVISSPTAKNTLTQRTLGRSVLTVSKPTSRWKRTRRSLLRDGQSPGLPHCGGKPRRNAP